MVMDDAENNHFDRVSVLFDQPEPNEKRTNDFTQSIQHSSTDRRPQTVAQQQQQHAARQTAAPLPIRIIIPSDALTLTFTGHQTLHHLQMNVMGNMGEKLPDELPTIGLTDKQILSLPQSGSRNL